jgi:RimJ/RimL family protein N-acetyltransferase
LVIRPWRLDEADRAVVERASGVPAGTVILRPLPDGAGEIEIGWHVHPDRWGRGFATEAAAAVLEVRPRRVLLGTQVGEFSLVV